MEILELAVTLEACKVTPGADKGPLDINAAVSDPIDSRAPPGKKEQKDKSASMETMMGMLHGLTAQVSTLTTNPSRGHP